MKKLFVLPVLLLAVAQGSAFADTAADPVGDVAHGTVHVAKDVVHGTEKAATSVGNAAKDVVVGTGKAVEAVGKGAEDIVTGK